MTRIIKRIVSPDGQSLIALFRREDGRFAFCIEKIGEASATAIWPNGNPGSAGFDSSAEAMTAACAEFDWLRAIMGPDRTLAE